jgi:hypothetical protein
MVVGQLLSFEKLEATQRWEPLPFLQSNGALQPEANNANTWKLLRTILSLSSLRSHPPTAQEQEREVGVVTGNFREGILASTD